MESYMKFKFQCLKMKVYGTPHPQCGYLVAALLHQKGLGTNRRAHKAQSVDSLAFTEKPADV